MFLFTFMYTGVLSACMSVYTVYSWLFHSPEEGVESPGTRISKGWAAIWVPGMKSRSCGRASSAPLSHHSSPYSNLCEEKAFKGIWEISLPHVGLRHSRLSPQVPHFKSLCDINIQHCTLPAWNSILLCFCSFPVLKNCESSYWFQEQFVP